MPPHMDDDDWFNGVHESLDKAAKELHESADKMMDSISKETDAMFKSSNDDDFVFELKINGSVYSDRVQKWWRDAVIWAKTPKHEKVEPTPVPLTCSGCGKGKLLWHKSTCISCGLKHVKCSPVECFYCGPAVLEGDKVVPLKDRVIVTEVLPQQRTSHYRTGLIHRVKTLPTKRVMTQQQKRYFLASITATLVCTIFFSPIPAITAVGGIITALLLRRYAWTVEVPK